MVGKSKKNIETEQYVDDFIKVFGVPPTYEKIEKHFNIQASAAYARCKKFRYKMRVAKKDNNHNLKSKSIVELRIAYEKRFISNTMTKEQLEGCESVWEWIVEMCGGF